MRNKFNAFLSFTLAIAVNASAEGRENENSEENFLTREQCQIIAETGPQKFVDDFVHMTSSFEWCGRDVDCGPLPLTKIQQPLNLSIQSASPDAINERKRRAIGQSISQFSSMFSAASNHEVTLNVEFTEHVNFRLLFIMSESDAKDVIARQIVSDTSAFEAFWNTPKGQEFCAARITHFDGAVKFADIWINLKLPDYRLRLCVFEELINSVGLFSDPEGFGSIFRNYGDITRSYKEIDIHLNFLYYNRLNKNMNADEIEAHIMDGINNSCTHP